MEREDIFPAACVARCLIALAQKRGIMRLKTPSHKLSLGGGGGNGKARSCQRVEQRVNKDEEDRQRESTSTTAKVSSGRECCA